MFEVTSLLLNRFISSVNYNKLVGSMLARFASNLYYSERVEEI